MDHLAGRRQRRGRRRAAGGDGRGSGAKRFWPNWAAQPHRPALGAGGGPGALYGRSAKRQRLAGGRGAGRARPKHGAHRQLVARLPGQPDGAGAGGFVYRRLLGVFGAGPERDPARPAPGLARRFGPGPAPTLGVDFAGGSQPGLGGQRVGYCLGHRPGMVGPAALGG